MKLNRRLFIASCVGAALKPHVQAKETHQFTTAEICRWFRVPEHLIVPSEITVRSFSDAEVWKLRKEWEKNYEGTGA